MLSLWDPPFPPQPNFRKFWKIYSCSRHDTRATSAAFHPFYVMCLGSGAMSEGGFTCTLFLFWEGQCGSPGELGMLRVLFGSASTVTCQCLRTGHLHCMNISVCTTCITADSENVVTVQFFAMPSVYEWCISWVFRDRAKSAISKISQLMTNLINSWVK